MDAKGNIIISTKSAILLLDLVTSESSIIAGCAKFGHKDGSAFDAKFDHPDGVLVLPNGKIVVADTYNHRIRLID